MAPDPEPRDLVVLYETEGAVPKGHAYGVDRFSVVNLLELEAGVRGVIAEESVGFPSRVPDFKRQLAIGCPEARGRGRPHSFSGSRSVARPAVRSARASAASFPSASREPPNCCAQRSSSRSSSSNQRPTRSCSSGGRAASFAIAASKVWVIFTIYPIPSGRAQPAAVAAERRWPPQVTSRRRPARPATTGRRRSPIAEGAIMVSAFEWIVRVGRTSATRNLLVGRRRCARRRR